MKSPQAIVKKLDPKLDTESEDFKIATVLIAATQVGPNADKIADKAKLPRRVVRKYAADARRAGVFKGGKIAHSGWFDKDGGIAFWLDVAVVRGFLQRVAATRESKT